MYSPVEARYFYDLVVRLIPVAEENVVHSVSQVMTSSGWWPAGEASRSCRNRPPASASPTSSSCR